MNLPVGPLTTFVLLVLGYGLTYFLVLQFSGRLRVRAEQRQGAEPPLPAEELVFWFLVPCLDEEAVIGATVANLLSQDPRARVTVVDDASADATAERARAAGGDRVEVLSRRLPQARQGKGAALNAALPHLVAAAQRLGVPEERVVVAVMDADGRLSPGALAHVAPLFADPAVGGAQLAVRIRNRDHLLTRIQDAGFWGAAATAQYGRDPFGTVSLGGNAQFARLSALRSVPGAPWTDSLTEDLDLALSLAVRGWRLRTTSLAHVVQEGPERLRALLRQRTRWAQGHMVCAGRLGEVWRSSRLGTAAALELALYLLQPWCLALPWSVLAHLLAVLGVLATLAVGAHSGAAAAVATAVAVYLLAFAPHLYQATLYHRRTRHYGWWRSVGLHHASYLLTYVTYLATWRALWRILRGRRDWAKTRRVARTAA
ncbi:glycosyltransferase family 2 protein, partial [Kitasatospora sp. NPDC057198]|uniref:glycosyltransferase family 2 protein n=1 Tax=Kitasatospora sp. NPDC057198 TaxID=3346046 RepID=UPI00362D7305